MASVQTYTYKAAIVSDNAALRSHHENKTKTMIVFAQSEQCLEHGV